MGLTLGFHIAARTALLLAVIAALVLVLAALAALYLVRRGRGGEQRTSQPGLGHLQQADDLSASDLEAPRIELTKPRPRDFARGFAVVWVLSTSYTGQTVAKLFRVGGKRTWSQASARAIRLSFVRLGPTYVKLGQLIASSTGVYPPALSEECQVLLDHVPGFSFTEVRKTIEEDLGQPLDAIFADFSTEPLASASIAQTHLCVLDDGREAVVKVQRPGLKSKINADLRITYRLAKLYQRTKAGRALNPVGIVNDLNRSMHQELNFFLEAHNQDAFRRHIGYFGDNDQVTAPEVYWPYCSRRVLCMERLYGFPVEEFDRVDALDIDNEWLLRRGAKVWVESALVHGLFHGDIHGGNIFVLDDTRSAYLDFGLVGELDHNGRVAIGAIFRAMALDQDWTKFVHTWIDTGYLPEELGDVEVIAAGMKATLGDMIDGGLESVDFGTIMQSLLDMYSSVGAETDPSAGLVMKQMLYMDRYAKRLAPDWNMATDLYLIKNVFPDEVATLCEQQGISLP